MHVARNAFGRQVDSCEVFLDVGGLAGPVRLRQGPGIEVPARTPEGIVVVRSGQHMAFAFHPVLGGDLRLHRMFLERLGVEARAPLIPFRPACLRRRPPAAAPTSRRRRSAGR